MKEYIKQFYNEGLATTFYLKPINFLDKKIHNNGIKKVLKILIKIIYTLFVMVLMGYIFYKKISFI